MHRHCLGRGCDRVDRADAGQPGADPEPDVDLGAQVRLDLADDELGMLGAAFHLMTQQLSVQRGDLMAANELIDIRRRFTEAVLSGVSAGVIGINPEGRITIVNRAAARLLDAAPEDLEEGH